MPATQHDAFVWLSGSAYDVVFDMARSVISREQVRLSRMLYSMEGAVDVVRHALTRFTQPLTGYPSKPVVFVKGLDST